MITRRSFHAFSRSRRSCVRVTYLQFLKLADFASCGLLAYKVLHSQLIRRSRSCLVFGWSALPTTMGERMGCFSEF